ncbi:hypothetical protein DXG03_006562 [Asterophora parasitica]|uniref:Uncharacterized protein n=1 Tax=Asterophora parasitica TaxID=117018 RepID=A0A9P7G9I2_9AGAR|nr:hypothetical protein DXG03_006562 [Asterophora parasitica]
MVYEEVAIMGANSDADIERATELMTVFDNYALTWTLAPFSEHGGLPPVVSFNWKNDTVYFSETTLTQLVPGGNGFGTFKSESTDPSAPDSNIVLGSQSDGVKKEVNLGAVLRYPRWGTRTHCAKIPDLDKNLIPFSQHEGTYLFTPRSVIQDLFSSFDLPYPTIPRFDLANVLVPGDTVPNGVDIDEIDFAVRFYNNGVAHSLFSMPVGESGKDGHGWMSVEQVLVRINTTYTPDGKFARLSDQSIPDIDGKPTYIGYDAIACVQLFEPWVLEIYNSTTGLPSSTRVVGKGNVIVSNNTVDREEKLIGTPLVDTDVNRALNSSNLFSVVNQMIKDNGRDSSYVPSPTVVSFTDGKGPYGYTELSPEAFARARGLADAGNILPYFAGSGKQLARRYPDHVLTSASINPVYMGAYLGAIFIIGLLAGFFVPKLPFNIPHRGFEVYTWMAAFRADELRGEEASTGIARNLELDDIAEQMGELKFRYIHPHTV